MTREEAKPILYNEILEATAELACLEPADVDEIRVVKRYIEALEVAIEALQERPKGRWIYIGKHLYKCSECCFVDVGKTNYCPACGADMRESE